MENKTQIKKGLICSILEDKEIGNCSNGGISKTSNDVLVIMEEDEAQVFEDNGKRPIVKIVRRIICGEEYIHAEPVNEVAKENVGYMMGGCFIWSSDSRFRNLVSQYPVALHDKQESVELNDRLSC